ncbi:BgtA-20524 [Blumeria graminis f. sp. tritici]|uniref:BgtA-20524 n=2 Tax=Blumeria graminis f. sp. tritici TaxID=62690 RepID=A0A9X9MLY9_BLUGR|nr:BgtA-20524 [Blumeria graminis f. sp. tritici]
MHCAIAFLMYMANSPLQMDRLVVTTEQRDVASYHVYDYHSHGEFPNQKKIDQFIKTPKRLREPGTYFMSYCSNLFTSHQIAYIITQKLKNITKKAHIAFSYSRNAEKECLKYLPIKSHKNVNAWRKIKSKLMLKVKRKCPNDMIVSLAYQGIFAVDGKYKEFFPPDKKQPDILTINGSMQMKSLVANGEFFLGQMTVFGQEALAWYQGHLHLFKRNSKTAAWFPVTVIGSESNNGWIITNFILREYPGILPNWEEFYGSKIRSDFYQKMRRLYPKAKHNQYPAEFGEYSSRYPFQQKMTASCATGITRAK